MSTQKIEQLLNIVLVGYIPKEPRWVQPQKSQGEKCEKVRPESKFSMLNILPKMLSQNFHILCSSVFPLCLHYAPRLATFLTVILKHCNQ